MHDDPPLALDGSMADSGEAGPLPPRIRQIDGESVRRICSGQVVTSLAVAIKELVENALDAGATVVEVRLRDCGLDLIEVVDNGRGISEADYVGLTARHATSKIGSFEDIAGVSSFGFRGEALSSLCEISDSLSITTRTAESPVATRLDFDRAGNIVKRSSVARSAGTTVSVGRLFAPLPVRLREFTRSLKRQYARALQVLQAYALVSAHARININNTLTGVQLGPAPAAASARGGVKAQPWAVSKKAPNSSSSDGAAPDGGGGGGQPGEDEDDGPPLPTAKGRLTVLSTSGSGDLRGSIIDVFGAAFAGTLLPFAVDLTAVLEASVDAGKRRAPKRSRPASELDVSAEAEAEPTSTAAAPASLRGFISKAGTGVGRANNEKQFFFLNGRPVELPRFNKALNEVWRTFEMGHKPAYVLDLQLPSGSFDVNVSPDKRDVFIVGEAELIACVKEALHDTWEPSRRTFMSGPLIAPAAAVEPRRAARDAATGAASALEPTEHAASSASGRDDLRGRRVEQVPTGSPRGLRATTESQHLIGRVTQDPPSPLNTAIGAKADESQTSSGTVVRMREPRSALATSGSKKSSGGDIDDAASAIDDDASAEESGENAHRNGEGAGAAEDGDEGAEDAVGAYDKAADNDDAEGRASREKIASRLSSTKALTDDDGEGHGGASGDEVDEDESGFVRRRPSSRKRPTHPAPPSRPPPQPPATHAPPPADNVASKRKRSAVVALAPSPPRSAAPLRPLPDAAGSHLRGHPLATVLDQTPKAGDAAVQPQAEVFPQELMERVYAARAVSDSSSGSAFSEAMRDWDADDPDSADAEMNQSDAVHARSSAVGSAGVDASTDEAEAALTRILTSASFAPLSRGVIGQFNNGFIIAALRGDLFILDQHACDEKSRFEALRASTTIHTQRLLVPRVVQLSAAEELLVSEHSRIFAANGFHFDAPDDSQPAGRRLRLLAVPFSKTRTFGDEDVRELAALIQEAPDAALAETAPILRLPKLTSIFASRACRSAIMIGTALKRDTMRRVVSHMGDLQQPWNCACVAISTPTSRR